MRFNSVRRDNYSRNRIAHAQMELREIRYASSSNGYGVLRRVEMNPNAVKNFRLVSSSSSSLIIFTKSSQTVFTTAEGRRVITWKEVGRNWPSADDYLLYAAAT